MDKKENVDKNSIKDKNKNKSKKDKIDNRIQKIIAKNKWDEKSFLYHCEISKDDVKKAKLTWEELAAIYEDHHENSKILSECAKYIMGRLQSKNEIHSVRSRIKSGSSLIKKVIRKNSENNKGIGLDNYKEKITDLIGLRALHLFKEDWLPIHNTIMDEWEHPENPIAYVREGDREEINELFRKYGCKVEIHPRKYRSIHYVIKSAPSKQVFISEIQVRTIFEEGWSEIDHRFNYPDPTTELIKFFLEIFNRFAGSADEMGSFIYRLVTDITIREKQLKIVSSEKENITEKLNELIDKLTISEKKRRELQKEVDKLKEYSIGESLNQFPAGSIPEAIGHSFKNSSFAQTLIGSLGYNISDFPASPTYLKTCKRCGKLFTSNLLSGPNDLDYCDDCKREKGIL